MSAGVKEWDSRWRGIIGLEYKAHQAWYARGRTGEGRMVLADENLQGARVASLQGVHLTRCDLSGAALGFSFMDDAEMFDCNFFDAPMSRSQWPRANLQRCNFINVDMGMAKLDDAIVANCNWTTADLQRSTWRRSHVTRSKFVEANLDEIVCAFATFERCDFSRATMRDKSQGRGNVAIFEGTRFTDCDFRGANITGLRLNNTTFERCKFRGIIGTPVLEGPITIIDADFSPDADGSDLRSQADIVAQWGGGTAP